MTDLFFGGSYNVVLRLLKKPKFAMFGEEASSSSEPRVEKGSVPSNVGEDS